MRVLLLHPDDSPSGGSWKEQRWDLVVDLGWAGASVYETWSRQIGAPVRGLLSYGNGLEETRHMRALFDWGRGRVVDRHGIDWWDLLAPVQYPRLHSLLLLANLMREIPGAEIWITRAHPLAAYLARFPGRQIRSVQGQRKSPDSWLSGPLKTLRSLGLSKIGEIALDKWDGDYRFRRLWPSSRPQCKGKVILVPSAYINVSRAASGYAQHLPDRRFLLVTTRPGGNFDQCPTNMEQVSLAAFASPTGNQDEIRQLTLLWNRLPESSDAPERLQRAFSEGIFAPCINSIPAGLVHRDAWLEAFKSYEVAGVLCADENNSHTRLPVVLARQHSIPTVYCAHGALDVTLLIRGTCSAWYLAKGEMERDYQKNVCGVPDERIVVGAASLPEMKSEASSEQLADTITYFSEPYELFSGRTFELYREILPNLARLARQHKKKVLLKLHPFESLRDRTDFARAILPAEDFANLEVTKQPMTTQLLRRTWFALTFESSVAVECAMAGVRCFICHWLDLGWYRYSEQYAKYGAARLLHSPADLLSIPDLIGGVKNSIHPELLSQAVDPRRLESLFTPAAIPAQLSATRQANQ